MTDPRWLLLAVLVTCATHGCAKPTLPPAAVDATDDTTAGLDDTIWEDVSLADTSPGAEVDSGVAQLDSANSDTTHDAGGFKDGSAADAALEELPPPLDLPGSPSPHCPSAGSGLPTPGGPCTQPGARRCTDLGRYASKPYMQFSGVAGLTPGFCIRPNLVRCEWVGAQLRWVAHACSMPAGPSGCATSKMPLRCVEGASTVRCCPIACQQDKETFNPKPDGTKYGTGYTARPCNAEDKGKVRCQDGGVGGSYRCGQQDEFADIAKMTKTQFHACAVICKGCRYWFRNDWCTSYMCKKSPKDLGKCHESSDPECNNPHDPYDWYEAKCVTKPDNTGACQKSCEDMGLYTP